MTTYKAACYDRATSGNTGLEIVRAVWGREAFAALYRRGRLPYMMWYRQDKQTAWYSIPQATLEEWLMHVSREVAAEVLA